MQYEKRVSKNGCAGCIAERDAELCCDLPLCSPVNNNGVSVIFIKSMECNNEDPDCLRREPSNNN